MNRDFTKGDMTYTGNELDVAIGGRGFFVVQDQNGVQRYTRDGRFHHSRKNVRNVFMRAKRKPAGVRSPSPRFTYSYR